MTEIAPGERHDEILEELLLDVSYRRVPDAYLAALAMGRNAELHSNDKDFERFANLRLRNPLEKGIAKQKSPAFEPSSFRDRGR